MGGREAGDACSSGWIKRCGKGRARLFLPLSLPLCSKPDLVFRASLHLVPPQCEWELSELVAEQPCPGGRANPLHPPGTRKQPFLPKVPCHVVSINHPFKKINKTSHLLASLARSADLWERKSAHLLEAERRKMRNKMLKSGSYSKLSLCMIILCLTTPQGCLEGISDLSFTLRDLGANHRLYTVW